MYAAVSCQILLEQLVDHTMPLNLGQALKVAGCYDQTEVCLCRCTVGHGLVVFVEVGVVVDLEARGDELAGNLGGGASDLSVTLLVTIWVIWT